MTDTSKTWRICPIADFFEVSTMGDVRSIKTNRVLKPSDNGKGYLYVAKVLDGKVKHYYVHRLIASAFLDNPSSFSDVNHKDGNKRNNAVENLEWCSHGYNINHAYKTGLRGTTDRQRTVYRSIVHKSYHARDAGWKRWRESTSKKVRCLSNGMIYANVTEASKGTGDSKSKIRNHCAKNVQIPQYSYI